MRVFDWERLCKEQRIPYIEFGANVKRGEIAIKCPFCGTADPSMHMGLSRETGWYSCWRNRAQHSGKSPLRLIMKLLRVSYGRAREIAGLGDDYIDPEGFDAMAARLMQRDGTSGRKEEMQRRVLYLDEFHGLYSARGRYCREYLDYRGFDSNGIDDLDRYYGVCVGANEFAGRIIFPYFVDDFVMTWTGRAIGDAQIRYKDLSIQESILPPKDILFNYDCIRGGGRALVIVEGPLDALKLDVYGRAYRVRAVALSTNSIKAVQAFMLEDAIDKFDHFVVMLDNATKLGITDSMRMRAELNFLPDVRIAKVPFGAKDAGALAPHQVQEWARSYG